MLTFSELHSSILREMANSQKVNLPKISLRAFWSFYVWVEFWRLTIPPSFHPLLVLIRNAICSVIFCESVPIWFIYQGQFGCFRCNSSQSLQINIQVEKITYFFFKINRLHGLCISRAPVNSLPVGIPIKDETEAEEQNCSEPRS